MRQECYVNARSPGNWAQRVSVNTIMQVEKFSALDQHQGTEEVGINLEENSWYVDVVASSAQIATGDLIRVSLQRDELQFLLFVEKVEAHHHGLRITGTTGYLYVAELIASPALSDPSLAITMAEGLSGFQLYRYQDIPALGIPTEWTNSPSDSMIPSIELLHFEAVTHQDNSKTRWLSNLGYINTHERFWGLLPDDDRLYEAADGRAVHTYSKGTENLLNELASPRFPLAAQEESVNWHYFPHNMGLFLQLDQQRNAEFSVESGGRLQREGLEYYDAQLFVDPRLQDQQGDALGGEAKSLAYLTESANSRKLRGLHNLLLLDEVSLLSVPDAVHRSWSAVPPDLPAMLEPPVLDSVTEVDPVDHYLISWSQSAIAEGIESYTLEWSVDPEFAEPSRITVVGQMLPDSGVPLELTPEPPLETVLKLSPRCPEIVYFRIRAEGHGNVSVWSNNKAHTIPARDFLACQSVQPEGLELILTSEEPASPDSGAYLSWHFSKLVPAVIDYFQVQRSSDPLFLQTEVIFNGLSGSPAVDLVVTGSPEAYLFSVGKKLNSTHYYRVRAVGEDTVGPWSNTLILWPENLTDAVLNPVNDFTNSNVLALHRAMIRCCYARGDLFGVLSLPAHYQVQDVVDHYALLAPGGPAVESGVSEFSDARVPPLSVAEKPALSHAALYYPWVFSPSESSGHSAISTGAWSAPANLPITEVLALNTVISDTCWARLNNSRVNVIRKSPNGFVTLSTNTLSGDSEFSEINVRRLISLLRRLVLREGNRYVFEPHSASFQERVQQHFETIFAGLFNRGAFSGATASQAYRVVSDTSVNTVASMEAGRFVVELWVAPSQALKFIKVRLMQSGPSQLQIQEVS